MALRDSGEILNSQSCLAWFYDVFYQISEERDKSSMAMYGNGMKAQVFTRRRYAVIVIL
jgi:predicted RNA-binding Zn ribbon-like protein